MVYDTPVFDAHRIRDFSTRYTLEPVFEPMRYTVLEPNDTISATLLVKHQAPAGKYQLLVRPRMLNPRKNMEGEHWSKKDFDRIGRLAWTHTDQQGTPKKPALQIGPFHIRIER
jgi:hypothetical protein